MTGKTDESYSKDELDAFKLHTDKSASDLYGMLIFKSDLLHVKYLNPTDFEVKNILLQIGELGEFPENSVNLFSAKADANKLFNKVDILTDLFNRQKIGYFGSSQYGIFSLVLCLTGFPFSEREEGLLTHFTSEYMSHNDHRTLIKRLDKPQDIFQSQNSSLGNAGLGQNLALLFFELPRGRLKTNFEVGQTVHLG